MKACLGELSVHGIGYTIRTNFHIFERIFWLFVVIASGFLSFCICLDQWDRFRNSPIVYTVEKNVHHLKFPFAGFTLCSNYIDADINQQIIKNLWNVSSENPEKLEHYQKFLKILSSLRYNNLKMLEYFKNDTTLNSIDFLETLKLMRSTLQYTVRNNSRVFNKDGRINSYEPVITEFGYCLTTSIQFYYQNECINKSNRIPQKIEHCKPLEQCVNSVPAPINDGNHIKVYVHNIDNIMTAGEKYITVHMFNSDFYRIDLEFVLNTAEQEVRKLPIAFRKCRYPNENNLEYFDDYTQSYCHINCRIRSALKLCNCKPYFYAVGPSAPICDLAGMLCLAKAKWPMVAVCLCYPRCEQVSFLESRRTVYSFRDAERSVILTYSIPALVIQKRVVFSIDQLVVSFGGATSFFLGCSFISFVEILYFLMEYCGRILPKLFLRTKKR